MCGGVRPIVASSGWLVARAERRPNQGEKKIKNRRLHGRFSVKSAANGEVWGHGEKGKRERKKSQSLPQAVR